MNHADILSYTGSFQDPVTGGYPLGNGYRMYLPGLMRFNAPDDFSPFGAGGVNCYAYCADDPVNQADPTGHMMDDPPEMEGLPNIDVEWATAALYRPPEEIPDYSAYDIERITDWEIGIQRIRAVVVPYRQDNVEPPPIYLLEKPETEEDYRKILNDAVRAGQFETPGDFSEESEEIGRWNFHVIYQGKKLLPKDKLTQNITRAVGAARNQGQSQLPHFYIRLRYKLRREVALHIYFGTLKPGRNGWKFTILSEIASDSIRLPFTRALAQTAKTLGYDTGQINGEVFHRVILGMARLDHANRLYLQ